MTLLEVLNKTFNTKLSVDNLLKSFTYNALKLTPDVKDCFVDLALRKIEEFEESYYGNEPARYSKNLDYRDPDLYFYTSYSQLDHIFSFVFFNYVSVRPKFHLHNYEDTKKQRLTGMKVEALARSYIQTNYDVISQLIYKMYLIDVIEHITKKLNSLENCIKVGEK